MTDTEQWLIATDGCTVHATREQMRDGFAVYQIWTGETLLFVGYTRAAGYMTLPDAMANHWFAAHHADKPLAVRLTHLGDRFSCNNERMRQVQMHRPECNLQGVLLSGRNCPIRCVETGAQYRNASEAAQANGIAPGNMSYHLSGKAGYKTVKGLTFVRVTHISQ
jgi:hypothetical protein